MFSWAQTLSFDTGWKFSLGNAAQPEKDFGRGTEYFTYYTKAASIHNTGPYAPSFDDSSWEDVTLPHDWVVDLPYAPEASKSHGYKCVGWRYPENSVGWYRKHFTVSAEDCKKGVSLRFDGIFRDSEIWVNGFWIGGEKSGYAPQSYDITQYLNPGEDNLVCVRADATFEEGWFYEGGGIYRHAFLQIGKEDPMPVPVRDGKRVKIRGVNLHQDHAGVGVAIPDALWKWRLLQLKKLGVNAIRTAHNPASESFLNLCDSLGIYVLEETRLMGINPAQLEPLRRMIERDKHHPSIIMWGIGNEEWGIEWTSKGEAIASVMTDYVHGLDPSRPVVVASSSGPEILKGADIAGYNYIRQHHIDEDHQKYPERVAVGTEETTGCGTRGVYFEEPGHAVSRNLIGHGMAFYEERDWLEGFFYWTGFDYRGEPDPLIWPATISEFGILDYCGFPKDEAWFLKAWWTDETVLHIFPHWNLEGHEGETIPIRVYSNCDEVALSVNGRNLGRKKMEKYGYLEWEAVYKPGKIVATGYKNGRRIFSETVFTAGTPAKLKVDTDVIDGLSIVNVTVLDAKGHTVPTAAIPVTITVEKGSRILGGGNGDPLFHGKERPASGETSFTLPSFNGCVQFIVEGNITNITI